MSTDVIKQSQNKNNKKKEKDASSKKKRSLVWKKESNRDIYLYRHDYRLPALMAYPW